MVILFQHNCDIFWAREQFISQLRAWLPSLSEAEGNLVNNTDIAAFHAD